MFVVVEHKLPLESKPQLWSKKVTFMPKLNNLINGKEYVQMLFKNFFIRSCMEAHTLIIAEKQEELSECQVSLVYPVSSRLGSTI